MKYFQTLPQVVTTDYNNNLVVLTNLLSRAEVIPALQKNPILFYQYDIQEGDTPEIIADKYYGDSYRYWLVLFANQLIDPQWDWPMKSQVFMDYLVDKYTANASASLNIANVTPQQTIAYTQSTIQNYYKTISTTDLFSGNTTTINLIVSSDVYANIVYSTSTKNFPDNNQVTQTISKYNETIFQYETNQNEAKRSIYLLNSTFVPQFESQLQSLMGT
jgi:hypothetical protein